MRVPEKILLLLALCHLILLCFGAAQIPLWQYGTLGQWLYTYGLYSGAGSRYAFFAPEVGAGYRTQFDLYDDKDQLLASESLYDAATREGNLRIANIIQVMSNNLGDPDKRQGIAASLAGKVFARHPSAHRLVFKVDSVDIPPMEEYRKGERYPWEPVYQAQYLRKPRTSRE